MKTKVLVACLAAAALAAGFLCYWAGTSEAPRGAADEEIAKATGRRIAQTSAAPRPEAGGAKAGEPAAAAEETPDGKNEPQTDEEKAEALAESKVEAFDALTDKWMEPSKAGVTMKDIDAFTASFRAIPKDRRDECIHRALNLIPDENVMLLAGVLMDKTADREIVETIFNDVLNRDEEVKKPILKEIFADKTHPCWADTAWILDVTGETPGTRK